MADKNFFNAADLDLEAALLAGFGLEGIEEDGGKPEGQAGADTVLSTQPTNNHQTRHKMTHRPGKVGSLQVTFVFHQDHEHQG